MPKTNDATGATYAGYEGVVEHAGGFGSTRPGGLSQLDPSREVDGSVVEGFESEEREIEPREDGAVAADFSEVHPVKEEDRSADEERERQDSDAGSQNSDSDDNPDEKRREEELTNARGNDGTQDKGGDSPSAGTSSSGSSRTRASSAARSSSRTR